jgi:hypothetical protein
MATTYQTIINMTDKQVLIDALTKDLRHYGYKYVAVGPRTFDPSMAACRNGSMPPNDAYATEAESVASAIAAYTATGHTAEEILSIETRACEST